MRLFQNNFIKYLFALFDYYTAVRKIIGTDGFNGRGNFFIIYGNSALLYKTSALAFDLVIPALKRMSFTAIFPSVRSSFERV